MKNKSSSKTEEKFHLVEPLKLSLKYYFITPKQ